MLRTLFIVTSLVALLRTSTVCAKSYPETRIVGGISAVDLNFPWMISILLYGKHSCGGSIINSRTILTAAHCLPNTDSSVVTVRVGSKMRSSGGIIVGVKSLISHENYNSETLDNDIGIIFLDRTLHFTKTIRAISLPGYKEYISADSKAFVSGWGYTNSNSQPSEILQYAVVPIVDQRKCNELLKNQLTDRMVCAGYMEGGIDACQLDSGGPLVLSAKLVGVVSWGIGCALPNKPGVYTRVSEMIPWIHKNINNLNITIV